MYENGLVSLSFTHRLTHIGWYSEYMHWWYDAMRCFLSYAIALMRMQEYQRHSQRRAMHRGSASVKWLRKINRINEVRNKMKSVRRLSTIHVHSKFLVKVGFSWHGFALSHPAKRAEWNSTYQIEGKEEEEEERNRWGDSSHSLFNMNFRVSAAAQLKWQNNKNTLNWTCETGTVTRCTVWSIGCVPLAPCICLCCRITHTQFDMAKCVECSKLRCIDQK